jgi:hypothetical protein
VSTNCPMYGDYYDPKAPIAHDKPVHHSGIQARVQDYPAECLWAQLQWEREQAERGMSVGPESLANLETEWNRRDLCSRCLLELDHPFMADVDSLKHAKLVADGKLIRIRAALGRLGETELRATLSAILDEPDQRP